MKVGWLQKFVTRMVAELLRADIEEQGKKIVQLEKEQATMLHRLDRIEQELNKLNDRMYETDMRASEIKGTIRTLIYLRGKSSGGE